MHTVAAVVESIAINQPHIDTYRVVAEQQHVCKICVRGLQERWQQLPCPMDISTPLQYYIILGKKTDLFQYWNSYHKDFLLY